jgi:hypothetical protein
MSEPTPKTNTVPCSCGRSHDVGNGESVSCKCGATIRRRRVGDIGSCIEIVPKR